MQQAVGTCTKATRNSDCTRQASVPGSDGCCSSRNPRLSQLNTTLLCLPHKMGGLNFPVLTSPYKRLKCHGRVSCSLPLMAVSDVWQRGTSNMRWHLPGRNSNLQSLFYDPMADDPSRLRNHLQLKGRSRRRMTTRSWPDWHASRSKVKCWLYLLIKMPKCVGKPSRLPIRADVVCPQCCSWQSASQCQPATLEKEGEWCLPPVGGKIFLLSYLQYSRKFFTSINVCKSPTNTPVKKLWQFLICNKVTISHHTPYNLRQGNGNPDMELSMYFNVKTIVLRLSKHVGRCRQRTTVPKWATWLQGFVGSYSDGRRVEHRLQKISAVCSMFLWQNVSIFCWVTVSTALWQCAQLPQLFGSINILKEEIFPRRNFHELVIDCGNRENFCLAKISCIRYFKKYDSSWTEQEYICTNNVTHQCLLCTLQCIWSG